MRLTDVGSPIFAVIIAAMGFTIFVASCGHARIAPVGLAGDDSMQTAVQMDRTNTSNILQSEGNEASVLQDGSNNVANVLQSDVGNTATVMQSGNANTANVAQSSSDNSATVSQAR